MEDLNILEAVERYISGGMSPDERVYFESLRKSNPEVDQLVVEHTFFLQQLDRYEGDRALRARLNETHLHLAESGAIQAPRLQGGARVRYLFHRYKRTAAIAASIAGITALAMSALTVSLAPEGKKNSELVALRRNITDLQRRDNQLHREINQVKATTGVATQNVVYTYGGTGFLIDPKGYLVTNAHIIKDARHVAVQSSGSKDLRAEVVYVDAVRDLAILQIKDSAYKAPSSIPYGIRRQSADISETVYTLGYPRNEVVYGEGYVAARTGLNGDSLTCQITIAANQGNSGGPLLNRNGEVVGILTSKNAKAEGVVYAIQSRYIHQALEGLKKDTTYARVKVPLSSSLRGMDRTAQVKKLSDFVFMVKVD